MKNRNARATAEWQEFSSAAKKFMPDGDTPTVLEANITAQRFTVWLPSGRRLIFRRAAHWRGDRLEFPAQRSHIYGRAGNRKRIVCSISPVEATK